MTILYISGSPRQRSNTDYLLSSIMAQTGGEFIKLTDYDIKPCKSCWACLRMGTCVLNDDMTTTIMPKIVEADAIVLGSPVFFNNVTAQMKSFIDRTWSVRGQLKDKIGAAVVVGRRYGAEGAITAINAFFLKHQMIIANRGISGIAFEPESIKGDAESVNAAAKLGPRILELIAVLEQSPSLPIAGRKPGQSRPTPCSRPAQRACGYRL